MKKVLQVVFIFIAVLERGHKVYEKILYVTLQVHSLEQHSFYIHKVNQAVRLVFCQSFYEEWPPELQQQVIYTLSRLAPSEQRRKLHDSLLGIVLVFIISNKDKLLVWFWFLDNLFLIFVILFLSINKGIPQKPVHCKPIVSFKPYPSYGTNLNNIYYVFSVGGRASWVKWLLAIGLQNIVLHSSS